MLNFTDKITLLDGAMGTMLQKTGIKLDKVPENINIKDPKAVIDIHRQYIEAGSEIIYANTFGVNRYKVSDSEFSVEELIRSGIENAKKACEGKNVLVALSTGPIGTLLEPNGGLSFENAYDIFREIVVSGEKYGADLIIFETFADLLEMKAAVLAAKENTGLPVISTMTFERNQRTFTGVSIPSMAVTLEGMGVDALGMNCSLGPDEMRPMAEELIKYTNLPVVIKANAGLPNLNSNEYDISAEEFSNIMVEYAAMGVTVMGGCCGTTPEYIKLIKEKTRDVKIGKREKVSRSVLCSSSRYVEVDGVRIVGERINPTGKKRFKEALINGDIGYIMSQAIEQVGAGAHILDVNVGLPGIDEPEMMVRVIKELQSVVDVPLQIDSSNAETIERALRIYNGKPILNSVNGEEEVLQRLLPLVKKYGCAVIGLTLDKGGIKNSAEERFEIARRITETALSYGIRREDIYIDCLTLTASVQQKEVVETLKAMQLVKSRLGVKTVLGVSNISFGLPARELINSSFLTLAMAYGLDLPIINPNIKSMTDAIDAFNVLYNHDVGAAVFIEKHSGDSKKVQTYVASPDSMTLEESITKGIRENAKAATEKLLVNEEPLKIINTIMIPALDKVGNDFEKGKIFLPQLMQSATAAQAGFEVIKDFMSKTAEPSAVSKGKIILATVQGDIHDIGKNIVKVILENYGYDVIDLGKDVPVETVVEETRRRNVKLVGLSALMTTTVVSMQKTIAALREAKLDCVIFVGGAVLTEDYAMQIGADFYAKDAKQSADIAKKILG